MKLPPGLDAYGFVERDMVGYELVPRDPPLLAIWNIYESFSES